jgi:hypothetical protein
MNQNEEQYNPVIFPFGPPVYLNKVAVECVEELDARIEEVGGKPEFDASGQLAGRILKQTHIKDVISKDCEYHILQHVAHYHNTVNATTGVSSSFTKEQSPEMKPEHYVLDSLWSNIQEAREFNPTHQHEGAFSFVIYTRNDLENMTVEEIQDNEYDNRSKDGVDQRANAGLIELTYGEANFFNWQLFNHMPQRGDIIMFPSWLRHTVYSFYEEGKIRISVAGNVNLAY